MRYVAPTELGIPFCSRCSTNIPLLTELGKDHRNCPALETTRSVPECGGPPPLYWHACLLLARLTNCAPEWKQRWDGDGIMKAGIVGKTCARPKRQPPSRRSGALARRGVGRTGALLHAIATATRSKPREASGVRPLHRRSCPCSALTNHGSDRPARKSCAPNQFCILHSTFFISPSRPTHPANHRQES